MKIEIGKEFPKYFEPAYRRSLKLFSHLKVTAGCNCPLQLPEGNGQPNDVFIPGVVFAEISRFFAVMKSYHTHAYANITRDKCFCISF